MNFINQLREYIDVLLIGGILGLWTLWQARGRKIQKQDIQIQKQKNDATIKPLQAEANKLDNDLEIADADRLQKEAELFASLNRDGNVGSRQDVPSGNDKPPESK